MKLIRTMIASVGATVLATNALAQAPTTNLLSETTFEGQATAPWSYGYFYPDNSYGTYNVNASYFLPEDVGQTNGMWQFTLDVTAAEGRSSWGTGTGGPLHMVATDPGSFTSGDRANYIFTFDARVEGLLDGQASANAKMQVQFYNGGANILQVNLPFAPTTNWQTFRFKLDEGGLGANTADADFAAQHESVGEVRFNVNLHEPFNTFGYDADNALLLDNAKLEVINNPNVGTVPTFGVPIFDWNMDDKGVWYEYHFDYTQNDAHAIVTGGNNANNTTPNTLGVDGTSAWYLTMDNSAFEGNVPQYGGVGTGGGGPTDFSQFNSSNLADYTISFDARADGLVAPTSTANLQIHLEAPDDTLTPADDDANADFLVRLDFGLARLSADWQHYSFQLSKAGIGGGAKTNFTSLFNKITGLRLQWQIDNATSAADWGYDADNALVVDNIKLERMYAGLPAITYTRDASNNLILSWSGPADGSVTLQAASQVDGPYEDVPTNGNTYQTPMTETQQYFRLASVPPQP